MTALAGRVAIVLGGESGIGLAIAERLAAAGVLVTIAGILAGEGAVAVTRLGVAARFHAVDVRSRDQVDALVDTTAAAQGRLDMLIYSAGVGDGFCTCAETSDALWDQVIDINLRGCFYACRAALRVMQPQGSGRIVNIASIAALRPSSNGVAYVAAKTGMVGLTRQVAATVAASGITVNAICPGVIETAIRDNTSAILGVDAPDMNRGVGATPDGYRRHVPAARRGQADEVAELALYLVGEGAGYVTGQAIGIDGGWSAT